VLDVEGNVLFVSLHHCPISVERSNVPVHDGMEVSMLSATSFGMSNSTEGELDVVDHFTGLFDEYAIGATLLSNEVAPQSTAENPATVGRRL